MPIVIDQVIGTVRSDEPSSAPELPTPPAPRGIDPRDLGRELRRMERRAERVRAD